MDDGRSMRAVETTPAASLNAGAGEELSSGLVWPVSLVPHVSHISRQRNYARSEGQSGEGVKCAVKQRPWKFAISSSVRTGLNLPVIVPNVQGHSQ